MANTKSKVSKTDVKKEDNNTKEIRVKKNLDPNMIVTVRNGFQGTLVYVSRKTHEQFVWDSFGDEQDMDLQELKNARNSEKGFFENNWFLIDDPEVIEYLGVSKFYKNALSYDGFDEIFKKTPKEIEAAVSVLSDGQKESVAYRARRLIESKDIDSLKVIDTLEKSLGIELIER